VPFFAFFAPQSGQRKTFVAKERQRTQRQVTELPVFLCDFLRSFVPIHPGSGSAPSRDFVFDRNSA
jgi:hypothetical protein